jgi:hypothetical protein
MGTLQICKKLCFLDVLEENHIHINKKHNIHLSDIYKVSLVCDAEVAPNTTLHNTTAIMALQYTNFNLLD